MKRSPSTSSSQGLIGSIECSRASATIASKRLEAKGASLVSLQESFDTGTESGQLYSTVLAMIAHVERRMIVARTRAGLQAARDRGQRLGGRPKMAPDQIAEARLMIDGGTKAEAVAARYNVARATLFRHLKSVRLHPPEPTVLG